MYKHMNPAKIDRNKDIVLKRKRNPKKWTFEALGHLYCIDKSTVYLVWKRDRAKVGSG